jgi:acetyl esterase/lipase
MASGIKLTPSIAYAERSRHGLDIRRPADAVAAPVVVFFYGRAWRSGNKSLYRSVGKAPARRGYVAAVPDYRNQPSTRASRNRRLCCGARLQPCEADPMGKS